MPKKSTSKTPKAPAVDRDAAGSASEPIYHSDWQFTKNDEQWRCYCGSCVIEIWKTSERVICVSSDYDGKNANQYAAESLNTWDEERWVVDVFDNAADSWVHSGERQGAVLATSLEQAKMIGLLIAGRSQGLMPNVPAMPTASEKRPNT